MGIKLKCLVCGSEIQSKSRHDFVECECRNCFVDGGNDYDRYGAQDIEYVMRWDEEKNEWVPLDPNNFKGEPDKEENPHKFRVWCGREYEYNVMAGFLGVFYVAGLDENVSACMSTDNTKYEDNEDIVIESFIGRKDKNNIEMYEGDIISYNGELGIIVWSKKGLNYCIVKPCTNSLTKWGLWWHYEEAKDFEVVGNIHENKDLLEEIK